MELAKDFTFCRLGRVATQDIKRPCLDPLPALPARWLLSLCWEPHQRPEPLIPGPQSLCGPFSALLQPDNSMGWTSLRTGFSPGPISVLGLFTLLSRSTEMLCLGPRTSRPPPGCSHSPSSPASPSPVHPQGRMFAARCLPLQSPRPGLQPGH